jgi:hypothetical protein
VLLYRATFIVVSLSIDLLVDAVPSWLMSILLVFVERRRFLLQSLLPSPPVVLDAITITFSSLHTLFVALSLVSLSILVMVAVMVVVSGNVVNGGNNRGSRGASDGCHRVSHDIRYRLVVFVVLICNTSKHITHTITQQ